MRKIVLSALLFAGLSISAPVGAQTTTLVLGRITTSQSCTYLQNSSGRAGAVVTPWAVGVYASWRTWWEKECVANFPSMRSTVESAFASSGRLRVGSRGARYSVSINITDVSSPNGPAPVAPERDKFSVARSYVMVSMDVSVRDGAGRVVFGGLLTKKLEIGSDIKVDGFEASSSESGPVVYGRLQNELGLAAARMVAFHFTPIQVTSAQGREIQVNYGSPLLSLGSLLLVASPDRRTTLRFRVTSATAEFSTAKQDGQGDPDAIGPGSIATFIEPEDPQQNGRRYERVDLP